jgi:hypothetical protein
MTKTHIARPERSFKERKKAMFVLQCKTPEESAWTDIYFDARSVTKEESERKMANKLRSASELLAPETTFQIIERQSEDFQIPS